MATIDRVKHRKTVIDAIGGGDSGKFGNETHFVSFTAIAATRNGTESSNFRTYLKHSDCHCNCNSD